MKGDATDVEYFGTIASLASIFVSCHPWSVPVRFQIAMFRFFHRIYFLRKAKQRPGMKGDGTIFQELIGGVQVVVVDQPLRHSYQAPEVLAHGPRWGHEHHMLGSGCICLLTEWMGESVLGVLRRQHRNGGRGVKVSMASCEALAWPTSWSMERAVEQAHALGKQLTCQTCKSLVYTIHLLFTTLPLKSRIFRCSFPLFVHIALYDSSHVYHLLHIHSIAFIFTISFRAFAYRFVHSSCLHFMFSFYCTYLSIPLLLSIVCLLVIIFIWKVNCFVSSCIIWICLYFLVFQLHMVQDY